MMTPQLNSAVAVIGSMVAWLRYGKAPFLPPIAAVHEFACGPSRHFGKMQNLVAIGA